MRTSLGGLSSVVFPEAEGPPSAVVVLCHGFGAPGDDLVGLRRELVGLEPALQSARFIFPEAPLSLRESQGIDGRAWWLIDFALVQAAIQQSKEATLELRKKEPPGMAQARQKLTALVLEASAQSGVPISRFILGGFSQGAMLATDVALRLEEAPLGLVALSGTLLVEDVWAARAKPRAGLPVFQSHGRQDPLLAFWMAERLRDLLVEAGLRHTWEPFDGGHQIPFDVLRKAARFCGALLTPTSAAAPPAPR